MKIRKKLEKQFLQGVNKLYDLFIKSNNYNKTALELSKLHRQSFVPFSSIEQMGLQLPKLYRLVKASDAKAITFFTIEGHDNPIGLIVVFYKGPKVYDKLYAGRILPHIQKLALLLDYEKVKK